VETLVVSRACRRHGIGRALMAEAAGWARRKGAAELVLTVWAGNSEAEAFYQRLGYRTLSQVLHAPL
jgi:ribosomal protein S18 acetylase RimI-like enzyme